MYYRLFRDVATLECKSWSRSKYTTTGERYNSARGPLREQLLAGTMEKWEDQNAPITADLIARLKKTTAVSSRNVVIYIPKWLHRETNDNTLNYSFWKRFLCIFPQTPCMNNPCQHGTSFCRPIYNRDEYQCVCKAGFTGKYCGTGEFNLILSDMYLICYLRVVSNRITQALRQNKHLNYSCLHIFLRSSNFWSFW